MRDATYSPSPLLNILHDPTLLSAGSTENLRGSRRPSRSPGRRREHRTPIVAAAALAEEERQANHLKSLLRISGDRLEYEMRRADEAVARADSAERQEREALRRARAAEVENERIQAESVRLERDMRNYQMQLEVSQREARRFQDDILPIEQEMEEVQLSEARAQESIRKYQATLREYERQMKERASQMKVALERWYESGRESGYEEGYDQGHQDGRRVGLKEGRKLGRKEGVIEGREQGHNEERRNAVEAFEKFLAEDTDEPRTERTRRWARTMYMADGLSEMLGPTDSGSHTMAPRKFPKDLPKLPLSAFTPPNTGTLESFPLPPSPSTLQPAKVIDANVISKDASYSQWKKEAGQVLGSKIRGIVLALPSSELEKALTAYKSSSNDSQVISFTIPFELEKPDPAIEALISSSGVPISLSTIFTKVSPDAVEGLRWALKSGLSVDIDVQATLSDDLLEGFEDLLAKASADLQTVPPIVLSNILPPPHDLDLPIVKLMNHPTYLAFQSQVAALSLIPQVYVKFLPPSWDAPTPQTPFPGSPIETADTQQINEWKRRIKMYLGPVMEAFGYQRIIFGSSPSSSSKGPSNVADWYEISRESLTELGIEQDFVDAVFYGNAEKVYSGKKQDTA
ncbi:hypothetical protein HYPSUDRAFT_128758 [Hypholoma sublateritium FD-334 SS-4]|uniref:Uncharacterized protein n=1 Tax=Hypholoma sublateritium (strain FD-334 SS-4) TaxID=945553 RepID=A0A0D2LM27_HYPSF|nr:hypothetical protein HYPSUDRAFT_128758 [Hypholoma sublateritium FD-334 SS-4]